jgi:hypothetical protein
MSDNVGFFRFDTNAQEVALEIESALRRITAASQSRGDVGRISDAQFSQNIQALEGPLSQFRQRLNGLTENIRTMLVDVGSGSLDPREFKPRAQAAMAGMVGEAQTILANSMADIPRGALKTLDMKGVMAELLGDVVRTAEGALQAYRHEAGGHLRRTSLTPTENQTLAAQDELGWWRRRQQGRLTLADEMFRAESRPFGGPEQATGLYDQLYRRKLVEDLLRQKYHGDAEEAARLVNNLGLSSDFDLMDRPLDRGGLIKYDGNVPLGPTPTDTARLLEDERKRLEAEERAAKNQDQFFEKRVRNNEREAKSAWQLADALGQVSLARRAVEGAFTQIKPNLWFDEERGRYLTRSAPGAAYLGNPIDVDRARQAQAEAERTRLEREEQERNYQRLVREGTRIGYSDDYIVGQPGGREVHRLTGETTAKRIGGELQVQKILDKQNATIERMLRAEERYAQTRSDNALRGAQRNSGLLGGFMSRFHRNEMDPTTGLGQSIASAAAFSFAYGSIFALGGAIADTFREFQDYQDSVTDLEVATQKADRVTLDWVDSLSQLSRLSGSNVGAALDAAARGVRAFTDPMSDTEERIQAVGTAMADASTKLALIANKDMRDATGDLVAVAGAYDLDPEQLDQITEAVAQAKRNLGGDPAQIAQGLALMAGTAEAAGFDPQEAANIVSLVQARTDQSGQVIATRLSRVFQIMSGSTGKGLAAELNVNPDLSIKEQLERYAKIYSDETTPEAIKDRITSALGGTANLREILPLLQEGSQLQKAYARALRDAGVATDEFNRKSDNMVGILKKIVGDIRNIQTDLARSGLFDGVGAVFATLEPALHGLDLLIKGYNKITTDMDALNQKDSPFKDWVPDLQSVLGVLATVSATAGGIAAIQRKRGLFQAVDTGADLAGDVIDNIALQTGATRAEVIALQAQMRARVGVESAFSAQVAAAGRARLAAEAAGGGIRGRLAAAADSRRGTFLGGLASIGRFLVNPWTLGIGAVVGGLALTGKYKDSLDARQSMMDQAAAVESWKKVDGSSESLRNAARDLALAAGTIKKTDGGWFGNKDFQKDLAGNIETQSKQVRAIAKRVHAEELAAASSRRLADRMSVFSANGDGAVTTFGELADGMAKVAAAGGTALTQMRLLREVLSYEPTPEQTPFQPERLGTEVTGALWAGLTKAIPKDGLTTMVPVQSSTGQTPEQAGRAQKIPWTTTKDTVLAQLHADNMPKELDALIKRGIDQLGLAEKPFLTGEDKARLTEWVTKRMDFRKLGDQVDEILKNALKYAGKTLESTGAGAVAPNLLNDQTLTPEQMTNLLLGSKDGEKDWVGLVAAMDAGMSMIPGSDDGSMREATIAADLRMLRGLKPKLQGKDHAYLNFLIEQKEHELVEAQVARINDLREAAESHAKSNRQLRAIRQKFAKRMALKALGDPASLEAMFELLDQQTINAVLDYLHANRSVYVMAINHTKQLIADAKALLRGSGGAGADSKASHIQDLEKDLRRQRRDLKQYDRDVKDAEGLVENRVTPNGQKAELPADQQSDAAAQEDRLTAAQANAMWAQAAVDPDDTIGAAQAALAVAQANQDAAKTQEERIAALREVTQAQDALDKAYASYAAAAAQVAAAQTNSPIDAAQAQIEAAAAMMNATAKGTEGYLQALAQWYQAQWALREAMLQYQANLDLLSGDMTDPVEQARDAARAARRKLRSDQANGAGKDVIAADQVAVEQSEAALEKAKWDQKLSDMKIAEQLGKISHAQYIAYLERESERMHKMKNKTRQQIDYMNAIDLELKNANDAGDALWNIGDINTGGIVYQMRRYKEEMRRDRLRDQKDRERSYLDDHRSALEGRRDQLAGSVKDLRSYVTQQVRIQIDGADVAKVRRIIDEYVGRPGRVRTTQSRRR